MLAVALLEQKKYYHPYTPAHYFHIYTVRMCPSWHRVTLEVNVEFLLC